MTWLDRLLSAVGVLTVQERQDMRHLDAVSQARQAARDFHEAVKETR